MCRHSINQTLHKQLFFITTTHQAIQILEMDSLEDSWWPSLVPECRPFTLPPSSQWLQRQDGNVLTIQAMGDPLEHRTNPNCLPFLMLLDMVQMTYLRMSNSSNVDQKEIFYKGVLFLDRLRGDFLAAIQKAPPSIQKAPPYFETETALLPESMQRWLCRLLYRIPHDPLNRKRQAETLKKAYLEVDIFKFGMPNNFSLTDLLINYQIVGF